MKRKYPDIFITTIFLLEMHYYYLKILYHILNIINLKRLISKWLLLTYMRVSRTLDYKEFSPFQLNKWGEASLFKECLE